MLLLPCATQAMPLVFLMGLARAEHGTARAQTFLGGCPACSMCRRSALLLLVALATRPWAASALQGEAVLSCVNPGGLTEQSEGAGFHTQDMRVS